MSFSIPLFLLGLNVSNFPSLGGGDGFDWNPEGVIFGHDYTTDRRFDGETVTNDFSVDLGGGFDPDEVTALGMAVADANANRPVVIGDLLTLVQTNSYACVVFWRVQETYAQTLIAGQDVNELNQLEVGYDEDSSWATDRDGTYSDLGIVRAFSDNVLAFSLNGDGVLASLNGATAVLDNTQMNDALTTAFIGYSGSGDQIEGWIKAIIFYPATSVAAEIEAYAANTAPVNTVVPAISGTAQEGQQLSVSTGTWTGSPTSYEYQWYKDNFAIQSAIGGATASTFTPTVSEVGSTMMCVVYALNADGIGGVTCSDDEMVIAA